MIISQRDDTYVRLISNFFSPLRDIGPHLPDNSVIQPLALFELFFDDTVVDRILESTLKYAEHKKNEMSASYSNFMKQPFTKAELFCYLGALMLLGLHGVKNYRHAWSTKKLKH